MTAWLYAHPHWAGLFAFLVAFGESLAIVGAVIPGSVTLTAIGVLIGMGVLPLYETMAWAIAGAILGDGVSYWVGRAYNDRIPNMWPFTKYPGWLDRGVNFFQRHGVKSIFIGRFFGPVRAILPLAAGMMRMPVGKFIIADIFSGILWAPAYLFPGILLGNASLELAPESATRLVLYALLGLFLIWLAIMISKWIIVWHLQQIDFLLDRVWRWLRIKRATRPLTILLQDPLKPKHHGQFAAGVGILLFTLFFLDIASNVSIQGTITKLDDSIWFFLRCFRDSTVQGFMILISFLGDKRAVGFFVIVIFGFFIYGKRTRMAAYWLLNAFLIYSSVWLLKHGFSIERPPGIHASTSLTSFPSGHTALATAIYGFFAALMAHHMQSGKKRWFFIPYIALVLLIAFSRMYLGAHWLSDVLAAMCLGGLVACFTTILYRRELNPDYLIKPALITAAAAITLSFSVLTYDDFTAQMYQFTLTQENPTISTKTWWTQQKPILPTIRYNRFKQPTALLNLQFRGSLKKLRDELVKRGWQEARPIDMFEFIRRLTADKKHQTLPILPHLYQFQAPAIVLTKSANANKPILVLRLWPSHYLFTDSESSLWIGRVTYRVLWQKHWTDYNVDKHGTLTPAWQKLYKDLSPFTLRVLAFPPFQKHERLMLIRSKRNV